MTLPYIQFKHKLIILSCGYSIWLSRITLSCLHFLIPNYSLIIIGPILLLPMSANLNFRKYHALDISCCFLPGRIFSLACVHAELIHANFCIVHTILSLPPFAPDPTASPASKKSTDYQNPWVEHPYLEKVEGVSKQVQPPLLQPYERSTICLTRPGDGPAPQGYGPHLHPRTPSLPPRPKFKHCHRL